MDSVSTTLSFGAGTDPFPYLLAAYGLGAAALVGFATWIQFERRRLRQLLATVRSGTNQRRTSRKA